MFNNIYFEENEENPEYTACYWITDPNTGLITLKCNSASTYEFTPVEYGNTISNLPAYDNVGVDVTETVQTSIGIISKAWATPISFYGTTFTTWHVIAYCFILLFLIKIFGDILK